jgi:hypothetical protein
MPDNEQRSKDRRLGLVAPLVIAGVIAALLLGGFLLQPGERRRSQPPQPVQPAPVAARPAPRPAEPPPLTRADLLSHAADVAGAYAAGETPSNLDKAVAGRDFALRVPFGCDGAQVRTAGEQAYVEYDPQKRTVHLVARPADWSTLPLIQQAPGVAGIEAVEGFWIPRPWLRTEACPPRMDRPAPATPTPPAAQTVGLATLFPNGGARTARRGERPYEFTRKVAEAEGELLTHSYHLVIEGRLAAFPEGRSIRCWSETPAHRPICLYAVAVERIAFEDAATGKVLTEWRE